MYSGALLWLVVVFFALLLSVGAVVSVNKIIGKVGNNLAQAYKRNPAKERTSKKIVAKANEAQHRLSVLKIELERSVPEMDRAYRTDIENLRSQGDEWRALADREERSWNIEHQSWWNLMEHLNALPTSWSELSTEVECMPKDRKQAIQQRRDKLGEKVLQAVRKNLDGMNQRLVHDPQWRLRAAQERENLRNDHQILLRELLAYKDYRIRELRAWHVVAIRRVESADRRNRATDATCDLHNEKLINHWKQVKTYWSDLASTWTNISRIWQHEIDLLNQVAADRGDTSP